MHLLSRLESRGIELDQRMRRALELSASGSLSDAHIFLALYRLNSLNTRFLNLDLNEITAVRHRNRIEYLELQRVSLTEAKTTGPVTDEVLERAIELGAQSHVLGTPQFLRALTEIALEKGDNYMGRPWSVDMILRLSGYQEDSRLTAVPGVLELISRLDGALEEDYQYLLAFQGGRLIFRPTSVLDDYVQRSGSGILVPQRAILTHFKDTFGGFTQDEIEELEALLNDAMAGERQFQDYFERHPHFFRKWDYREVYPHVMLSRPEGPLIPDFLLTDRELQRAAIVELKLPKAQLVRRQDNRDRFAAAISEARTQLLRYRDWFRESSNRQRLVETVGMEIYEPQLTVVIGRSAEFRDAFDRQRLVSDASQIEVVTFDEILTYAKRRRVIIESAGG